LRDLGNSVLVVEHDEEAINTADWVIDMGPGAGEHGGHIVTQGLPADILAATESLTGQYLSGKRGIAVPVKRHKPDPKRMLRIVGATGNNLKSVTLDLPVGLFVCVTGVSGSGRDGRRRAHAALEPRDLHGAVHADPRDVRAGQGVARARLRAGALLVQREGRPLRGLPG
jgi:excinuclease ABC subunit A